MWAEKHGGHVMTRITVVLIAAACAVAGCSSRETVLVYSPHGPDVLREYEKRFEAIHPEVDVQWLDMGSKEVYERIRAEQRRPVADLWWGAPATMFMQAADDGLLASYEPSWASHVGEGDHDAAHRWYGIYRSPLVIMYNSTGYTAEEIPQTWDALLDEQWHGRITIRSPLLSGTMRTFIGAMILRQGNEDAAMAWFKELHASTESYVPSPQDLYDHVRLNPELISVWLMPDVLSEQIIHGYPLDYVVPHETPVLVEGIAIVENAPHRQWAEAFYEFVTSKESLAHQSHAFFKAPLRTDMDSATLPERIRSQTINAMEIDWTDFSKKEQAWAARWEKEVKSGR
jgi:iron(III) transport system substrate-binding protein